jgi:hypothetical protein
MNPRDSPKRSLGPRIIFIGFLSQPELGLKWAWRFGMTAGALALLPSAALLTARALRADPYVVDNPPLPPDSQDQEGMFGKDGPFHPAGTKTTTGGRIPSTFFMTSKRCADCHPDIFRQWSESAHRFSSFNN